MEGRLAANLAARYSVGYGGGLALLAVVVGGLTAVPTWALGLLMLMVGGLVVVTTLTGANGVGAGGMAIEPASGVDIDPFDYVQTAVGVNALKALFFGAGLVAFGGAVFVAFG
ncbi:MAG: hypothetical protein GWN07_34455 [Actinobacteria bacterium]|nr:hypothetical protein [Actinomycetota bacterium]NIU70527.1 hypothetical protein [Actinomycetota bacterium]NIW32431.1 hypothetical protein [Actinomycetota bacterium]NIX24635.1 hypothetical protein [Actinomycetota bacterium]